MIASNCQLIQGSCIDLLDSLEEKSVDLVLTDPPYNVNKFIKTKATMNKRVLNNIDDDWDKDQITPDQWVPKLPRILKNKGNVVIFCAHNLIGDYVSLCNDLFSSTNVAVWHKTNPTPCMMHTTFVNALEYMIVAWNKPHTWNFTNHADMHNVFRYPTVHRSKRYIKVQKPVSLLQRLIKLMSNEDAVVLDPFMGSGSTGEAALEINRRFVGFDLDPTNFNIAYERLRKQYDERNPEASGHS